MKILNLYRLLTWIPAVVGIVTVVFFPSPAFAGEYFNGQIDDVRIYNYTLTASQIKTLYNDGAVRFGPASGTP